MSKFLSKDESLKEIEKQYVAKLGYISGNSPFIVPITYYYDKSENCIMAFSAEGHKIDGMRVNKTVCLYVDEIDSVKKWKSILIHGAFEEFDIFDREFYLKKLGKGIQNLLKIKKHKATRSIDEFSNIKFSTINPLMNPIVYRIKIWDVTGRYMK